MDVDWSAISHVTKVDPAEPLSELTWVVCPAPGASFTLWEDDGKSFGYRLGREVATTLRTDRVAGDWRVVVEPRRGAFEPDPRTIVLQVHVPEPATIELDGAPAEWTWNEHLQAATVRFADDGGRHELVVRTPS
jgi:alpha-glucosidase